MKTKLSIEELRVIVGTAYGNDGVALASDCSTSDGLAHFLMTEVDGLENLGLMSNYQTAITAVLDLTQSALHDLQSTQQRLLATLEKACTAEYVEYLITAKCMHSDSRLNFWCDLNVDPDLRPFIRDCIDKALTNKTPLTDVLQSLKTQLNMSAADNQGAEMVSPFWDQPNQNAGQVNIATETVRDGASPPEGGNHTLVSQPGSPKAG